MSAATNLFPGNAQKQDPKTSPSVNHARERHKSFSDAFAKLASNPKPVERRESILVDGLGNGTYAPTPQTAQKSDAREALSPRVKAIAGSLPIEAAQLLDMIFKRYDEAPNKPVAFGVDEVARHFKIAGDQAEAVIGLLTRRGLLIPQQSALGGLSGYRPYLPN